MSARFLGIAVSTFLSIASVVLFIKPGLNYGIDFVGGILVEVRTAQPADLAALRGGSRTLASAKSLCRKSAFGDSSVLMRVERQPGGEQAQIDGGRRALGRRL